VAVLELQKRHLETPVLAILREGQAHAQTRDRLTTHWDTQVVRPRPRIQRTHRQLTAWLDEFIAARSAVYLPDPAAALHAAETLREQLTRPEIALASNGLTYRPHQFGQRSLTALGVVVRGSGEPRGEGRPTDPIAAEVRRALAAARVPRNPRDWRGRLSRADCALTPKNFHEALLMAAGLTALTFARE